MEGTESMGGFPGLKIQTWGTRRSWWVGNFAAEDHSILCAPPEAWQTWIWGVMPVLAA
jgi:hypothetical protein